MFFDEDEDARYLHDQGECDPATCEFCQTDLDEDEYVPLDLGLEDFIIEPAWEEDDNDY
jgi:hypothetical protein